MTLWFAFPRRPVLAGRYEIPPRCAGLLEGCHVSIGRILRSFPATELEHPQVLPILSTDSPARLTGRHPQCLIPVRTEDVEDGLSGIGEQLPAELGLDLERAPRDVGAVTPHLHQPARQGAGRLSLVGLASCSHLGAVSEVPPAVETHGFTCGGAVGIRGGGRLCQCGRRWGERGCHPGRRDCSACETSRKDQCEDACFDTDDLIPLMRFTPGIRRLGMALSTYPSARPTPTR
jgi:hypothetical protein